VVGRGGFGVVYRAHHLGFNEKVAVKCLRTPQTLSGAARDEFERNFLAEGRLLHQLSRSTRHRASVGRRRRGLRPTDVDAVHRAGVARWAIVRRKFREARARRAWRALAARSSGALGQRGESVGPSARTGHCAPRHQARDLFLAEVGGRKTLKVLDFGIAKS